MKRLFVMLFMLCVPLVAQTTTFAGGYIGYSGGLGFRNPAFIGLLGAEGKTQHWYWHAEGTVDSADKVTIIPGKEGIICHGRICIDTIGPSTQGTNPATSFRIMGDVGWRIGSRWYAGIGESGGYLRTDQYSKLRQNGRLSFGRLGEHFDSHAAYLLPFGNPERVQGGEYELVWHVRKHIALLQKYQLLVCKVCVDPTFHEGYLAGTIAYGARYQF